MRTRDGRERRQDRCHRRVWRAWRSARPLIVLVVLPRWLHHRRPDVSAPVTERVLGSSWQWVCSGSRDSKRRPAEQEVDVYRAQAAATANDRGHTSRRACRQRCFINIHVL